MKYLAPLCLLLCLSWSAYAQSVAAPQAPVDIRDERPESAPQIAWDNIPKKLQNVLSPLQKDWGSLPGLQQKRLLAAAHQYPKMQPIQQERFQERIKNWAQLSPEQRLSARTKYKNLARLPPQKQHAIKERWLEKQAGSAKSGNNAPSGAVPAKP